jgi:hypothetical protein
MHNNSPYGKSHPARSGSPMLRHLIAAFQLLRECKWILADRHGEDLGRFWGVKTDAR